MDATTRKGEAPGQAVKLPKDYDDNALKAQLSGVQSRTRRLMDGYGIASGHVVAMARQAERAIADDAQRAEFLMLLIELQEFGAEAKRRGLLRSAVGARGTTPTAAPAEPETAARGTRETGLFDSDQAAGDEVDEDATRDFFNRLDR